jgi:hypothetical protein
VRGALRGHGRYRAVHASARLPGDGHVLVLRERRGVLPVGAVFEAGLVPGRDPGIVGGLVVGWKSAVAGRYGPGWVLG